jgi:hypothetical protein
MKSSHPKHDLGACRETEMETDMNTDTKTDMITDMITDIETEMENDFVTGAWLELDRISTSLYNVMCGLEYLMSREELQMISNLQAFRERKWKDFQPAIGSEAADNR